VLFLELEIADWIGDSTRRPVRFAPILKEVARSLFCFRCRPNTDGLIGYHSRIGGVD
jgi:hypothetical protein